MIGTASKLVCWLAVALFCAGCASTGGGGGAASSRKGATKRPSAAELNAKPGEYWLGQRFHIKDQMVWGWVKRPDESWDMAVPVLMREEETLAPHRALAKPTDDHNHQYRLYGYFWEHRAYEPVLNRLLDVFVLQKFEPIGPAEPLPLKGPSVGADAPARASRSSARSGNTPVPERGSIQYENIE